MDDAERVLEDISKADHDAAYEKVTAQIKLKKEAARSPELDALELELERNLDDLEVRVKLAVQYTSVGQHRKALEALIFVLEKDVGYGNGATKKMFLDTIASLGKADPLAAEFQRKLFSLLY